MTRREILPSGLRHWVEASLVRRITLQLALVLIASVLAVLMFSGAGAWLLVERQARQDLDLKADALAWEFEGTLDNFSASMASLARNRLLTNALLDSRGRDQYLRPFLREYDIRIDEVRALTLCDFLGRPLASSGVGEAACFHARPEFKAVLESGRSRSLLLESNARPVLVLLEPVIFPTTGTAEGVLAGQFDLAAWFDAIRHVPAGFAVRLRAGGVALVGGPKTLQEGTVRSLKLPESFALHALTLEFGRSLPASKAGLHALLLGEAIAALVLLAIALAWARHRVGRSLRPVRALLEAVRGNGAGRPERRADASRADELGELGRAYNRMLDELASARVAVDAEVALRIEAAHASERRERRRADELAAVLEALPALVLITHDSSCSKVVVNRALATLLPELERDAAFDLRQLKSLQPAHYGTPLAFEDWPLVKAAREQIVVGDFPLEITLPSGEVRQLLGTALPMRLDGQPAGAVATYSDVTRLRQAEAAAHEEGERYQRLFELMPEGVCVLEGARVVRSNTALARLTGYEDPAQLVGQHVLSFVHAEDRQAFGAMLGEAGREALSFRLIRRDGSLLRAEIRAGALCLGGQYLVQAVIHDVSSRARAEEPRQIAERVFAASQDGIFLAAPDATLLAVNPACVRRSGYSQRVLDGASLAMLCTEYAGATALPERLLQLCAAGPWEGEVHNRRGSGELVAEWLNLSAVFDADGKLLQFVGVLSDLIGHRAALTARHDDLTGLPDRLLLNDRIGQAISQARRDKGACALIFVDLDGFGAVNQAYGHATGDGLLIQVAARLSGQLRDVDSVARYRGDEFLVLLPGLQDASDAGGLAAKLCAALAHPYHVGGSLIEGVSASLGIAVFPQDGEGVEALVTHAEEAMYLAKGGGKNTWSFYRGSEGAVMLPARPTLH